MSTAHKNAILLLKLGVGFALLYPAISAFVDSSAWIGYVPVWIDAIMPREMFLAIFSSFEILVAVAVLFWNNQLPYIVAGLILVSIVAFNKSEFSVVFRDLPIACMAFALAFFQKSK